MKKLITLALAAGCSLGAWAQVTPVGLWKTVDDETGKEKSYVRIVDSAGVLTGKVEKILDPAKADSKCVKCSDDRKDQPNLGLTIIRGVKPHAGNPEQWDGGEILDPNNGKTYRVRLQPVDGGKKLEVRGYIGTPLLGRTQTWLRIE
jgi:uncharacterized protein (DUF2147 family)